MSSGDTLAANMLLLAQAIDELADHLGSSTGIALTGVPFASLPASPTLGMLAVVTDDSGPPTWASAVSGGGSSIVLCWFNGTAWTVVGK